MSGPVDWTTQGGYGGQPSYPQQGYPQQGYPQPQGGGYGSEPIPPTNAGWAVAATLFFWPLAFTAWSSSSDVVRLWVMGDRAGSRAASDRAKKMGKIALWIGIAGFVLIVVLYVAVFAVLLSAGNFSTTSTGFS